MRNPFFGPSMFIWQVKAYTAGQLASTPAGWNHILQVLQAARLETVFVKVADSTGRYNLYPVGGRWEDSIMHGLAMKLREAGRAVVGWHYIYGRDPLGEAERAAERIRTLGLDGYILDPEREYKAAGDAAARAFMGRLKALCPDTPLALCSYRFPSVHRDFPWRGFLDYLDAGAGDVHMPQVYWLGSHGVSEVCRQTRQSIQELQALKDLPVVPVGPVWGQRVGLRWWEPTIEEMLAFAESALFLGAPGVSWYSWDKLAEQDSPAGPEGSSSKNRRWWKTIKGIGLTWPAEERPPENGGLRIDEPGAVGVFEWARQVDPWARSLGYTGPRPG